MVWFARAVEAARVIEQTIAATLEPRGYRRRSRNWFRTTSAGEYQVVNLQRSPWGGGSFHLNLGWDPHAEAGTFTSENHCLVSMRAEQTGVMPTFDLLRPDGETTLELPAIALLDADVHGRLDEQQFTDLLVSAVVRPIADLLDRTPSISDIVTIFEGRPPFLVSLDLRRELSRRGLADAVPPLARSRTSNLRDQHS